MTECFSFLQYEFMQNALIAALCMGLLCPVIGIFIVLRRFSMLGDTMAHSSLAGASVGLLLHANPVAGAFVCSIGAGLGIEVLRSRFPWRSDLILSIVLALFAGVAVTIMSSGSLNGSAESYLFGSILTVDREDIRVILALTAVTVFCAAVFRDDLMYLAFDEQASLMAGVRVRTVSVIFSVLSAAAVAVSIKIIGALVISAMMALPVASALLFHRGFRATFLLSVFFSVITALSGLVGSYYLDIAPGGATALFSVALLLCVMAFTRAGRGRV